MLRSRVGLLMAVFLTISGFSANAQTGTITTYAGALPNGFAATDYGFFPQSVVVDQLGNLYVAVPLRGIVLRMDQATQILSVVAGNGAQTARGDNGPATLAGTQPWGLAIDNVGNLFIADNGNYIVRRVDAANGLITTVAGNGLRGFSGDNGPATSASMSAPVAVALDSAGNLFVADTGNNNVRRVDAVSGIISTVAGNGTVVYNGDNIPATSAAVAPTGVALDRAGNLFIEDRNQRIRRVDATTQIITTFAGNGVQGYSGDNGPATNAQLLLWNIEGGIAFDGQGNLLFADNGNSVVRRVDALTGIITTVAGNGQYGFSGDGGPGTSAILSTPIGMAVDAAGNFYFCDAFNYRVREVNATTQTISTLVGNGTVGFRGDNGAATSAELNFLGGLALDSSGNLFLTDGENRRVRRIDRATKVITTVAGNGKDESSGDNGPAVAAGLPFPQGVALDSAGNLFIADDSNVRRVDAATGIISRVAGDGNYGFNGDNRAATNATLAGPLAVVADKSTNLFIADSDNHRVRRVDAKTGIITTVAGNGLRGYTGDNGPATSASIGWPVALALDDGGNIFIADGILDGESRIRRVDGVSGIITTVAGNGVAGFSGDGGLATDTSLNHPNGILVDGLGNLWISDFINDRVRRVDAVTGVITTAAGNGMPGYSGDGGPVADAMLDYPAGIAIDGKGNLFVATFDNRIRQVALGSPALSLSTNAVNFGSAPVFSTQTAAVTVANTGIIPNQFSLSIVGSSVYSETDNCGSVVQPNGSCAVQLSFVPAAIGAQGATLKITSNVPEASGAVALSGLGIVAATTTTLTSNVNPSYPNQAVTFTATVSAPTGGLPSGTVTFRQGAKLLGATTLSGGQAVYGTSYTTTGTRIITASYAGDADFAASTSSPLKQVVRALPAATQTTVTSSADPSHLGNAVTFTATASSTYGAIPDGELITFYRGLTTLGSAPLTAGVATYSTSALTLGGHTIRAAYPGDATFKPSTGTIRQTVTR